MANNNEDRGFNTVNNSSLSRRDQRIRLQRMTLITIAAVLVLMVVTLIALIISAIAGAGNNDPSGNGGNGNVSGDKIVWSTTPVSAQDTLHGPLALVNSTHQYTFPASDEHLSTIYDFWKAAHPTTQPYKLSMLSPYMETVALTAMDRLLTDFSAATGKTDVVLRWAYRSAEDQTNVGSSTPAGYSDHHTGMGCTLSIYDGTNTYPLSSDATYNWITDNAAKYGFIVRYPADKADLTGVSDYTSYFRYVGVAHATYMKANNLCMEEYIDYLKANVTDKSPLTVTGADGRVYDIYYYTVNGSASVKVPTNYSYTLSGTNDGGVVVTIDRSPAPAEADTTADTVADTTVAQ